MRLNEIMSTDVLTAEPNESAPSASERMKQQRIHHLVVMEGNALIGVISSRDLQGQSESDPRATRTVAELMTKTPITASPRTTAREAANRLRGRTIGCLPVVEGKKVVGIITTSDLLDLIGRGAAGRTGERPRPSIFRRAPR